ncbi:MAG: hypothetical protein A3B96_00135 [Candidatus Spechtbacteria bacterium RIFCSPHIGHO2_02_FULL_43_15b]|nr:MAG: hypothetical protein A3B96_00135 [Candidatus Spechtbacteria bacterium RIFCSPHIGHO2_02_FULL_43_15b]
MKITSGYTTKNSRFENLFAKKILKGDARMAKFFWDYRGTGKPPKHLVSLEDMLGWQDDYLDRKVRGDKYNFILVAEHEPLYCCPEDKVQTLAQKNRLFRISTENLPAPFFSIPEKHGGSITYHGPGQLTCYFILCLEDLGIGGPKQIGAIFDEILKDAISQFGINGFTADELRQSANPQIHEDLSSMSAQGIWVRAETNQLRKIASRALRIVRYVLTYQNGRTETKHFTKFGFALNISTDLDYFSYIYPCGLDIQMTSIKQITGKEPLLTDVAKVLSKMAIQKLDRIENTAK